MNPSRTTPPPRVEVRRTSRGLELRLDGTLASSHPTLGAGTGPVWDALALPVLALPPERRGSALILGLGGGSVARVLRALAPRMRIVGVEIDLGVVAAARSHLGLDAVGVEVVLADALAALRSERRRFDLIVEDVFIGAVRDVRKPAGFPEPVLGLARRRLAPGGLIVCNTIHEGPAVAAALRANGDDLLTIHVRGFWNRILVAGRSLDAGALRRAAAREEAIVASLPSLSIRRAIFGGRRG
jgi:spermidine synthase